MGLSGFWVCRGSMLGGVDAVRRIDFGHWTEDGWFVELDSMYVRMKKMV